MYSRSPPHTAFVPFVQSSTKRCIGNYISLASQLVSAVVASFIWGLPPLPWTPHRRERERGREVVKEVGVMFFCVCVCVVGKACFYSSLISKGFFR